MSIRISRSGVTDSCVAACGSWDPNRVLWKCSQCSFFFLLSFFLLHLVHVHHGEGERQHISRSLTDQGCRTRTRSLVAPGIPKQGQKLGL